MIDSREEVEPEYIAARTVLLDALEALEHHRQAVVVVGAQAVYLRTGAAGLTVAPFTTDGDLALDPALLGDDPLLEAAMARGGFHLHRQRDGGIEPGTWVRQADVGGRAYDVPIDLIVPEAALPGGRTRGARLPVHGKRAAKRTHGLEAALVDHDVVTLTGMQANDRRRTDVAVAGVAALLVAKVHKLRDRVAEGRPARLLDKDAGDVLRIIRATPVAHMARRLTRLSADRVAGTTTEEALIGLSELFRAPNRPGVVMAVRAVQLDLPAEQVETQITRYVAELRRLVVE